eukprot:scaffold52808_cov49-Cyclotella_meneghiniana.AAC.9
MKKGQSSLGAVDVFFMCVKPTFRVHAPAPSSERHLLTPVSQVLPGVESGIATLEHYLPDLPGQQTVFPYHKS